VTDITAHLANIVERIARATEHARRARDSVQIIAISKQQPASAIAEAYAAGVRHFGESYVQEALPKMAELQGLDITWHFVGRLQANKTRAIAELRGDAFLGDAVHLLGSNLNFAVLALRANDRGVQ